MNKIKLVVPVLTVVLILGLSLVDFESAGLVMQGIGIGGLLILLAFVVRMVVRIFVRRRPQNPQSLATEIHQQLVRYGPLSASQIAADRVMTIDEVRQALRVLEQRGLAVPRPDPDTSAEDPDVAWGIPVPPVVGQKI